MTVTINAVTSTGLVQTSDGSGVIKLQSNGVTTNALAWVNFNGTGTVAIRSSYNVSSITDNGTGDYTVNFTNALSDANYTTVTTTGSDSTANSSFRGANVLGLDAAPTTSAVRVGTWIASSGANRTANDSSYVFVSIFGN